MPTSLSSVLALSSLLLSLPSSVHGAYSLEPTEECPILGPIWPAQTYDLTTTTAFSTAVDTFPSTIQALFDAQIIDPKTSTFALDVYSTRTNESIYSYFHLAENEGAEETLTAGVLDDETVFRTGSVSKLHTVYAILVAGGKGLEIFDEKVTKYVPELSSPSPEEGEDDFDPLTQIKWDDITIGALASQQGGVGGPSVEVVACGCNTTVCDLSRAPACAQDFLTYMRDTRHPATPVYGPATYADAGFIVLTQVLVSMTNLTYDEAAKKYIAEPLGMNVTGSIAGEAQEANAVVLGGSIAVSNWGIDNQVLAGSGGIYSNLRDLRTLGLSILNHELLSPQTTNQWLKPSGFVGSPYKVVGAPWEIERLAIPISPNSSRTRISDQYTKGGGQPGYTAIFALSPDHGIGYSVLVAGPGAGGDRWPLRAALGEAFVTAAEWAGFEHASDAWQGVYVDENDENGSTNLTLAVRPDHPGIGLEKIFIDGVDWRSNITSYQQPPLPAAVLANLSTPMYPTGLAASKDGCQRLQYRATPFMLPHVEPMTRAAAEGGTGLFDDVCGQPWSTTAFFNDEKGAAIDEFMFVFDSESRLESVEYPSTGARFVRAN